MQARTNFLEVDVLSLAYTNRLYCNAVSNHRQPALNLHQSEQ